MNENTPETNQELIGYQTLRFQDLMAEMLKCCEDRKLYESQKFGVPYAEQKCLMLFNGQRYLTVKSIAQSLDVAKSRVTKLMKGLSEKGLIGMIDDPKDARVKLISLTSAGEKKAEEICAFQREIHRKILLSLDPPQRKDVLAHLEMLRSSMEAVKEEMV